MQKNFFFTASLNDTNYRYLWTFGDGGMSDNRIPVHIYDNNGKYKVCLKVTKKDSSCTLTVCDSILVGTNACNASFAKNASNSVARTYSFEAILTSNDYFYKYTFGDGTSSTGRVQTHTYALNGTYTVCLTVTKKDSSCSLTQCQTIIVSGNSTQCSANFTAFKSDSVGSNPNYVRFADISTGIHTRCIYNFGDGTTSDNCNPIHYYSSAGTRTVCLTIYRISNGDTLCKSTTCKTVTSGSSAPAICVATFNYERIGLSSTYRFVNHSLGSPLIYKWVFDGGTPITSKNVEHDFVTPGLHLACLYVTNALDTTCKSSFCVNIMFPGVIAASQCVAGFDIIGDQVNPSTFQFSSFSGSNLAHNWNFGDGSTSTDVNATHTFGKNGSYFVCLSILNPTDSCSDMHCDSVVVTQATGLAKSSLSINQIYPVPVQNKMFIRLQSNKQQVVQIKMIDITGKILIEKEVQLEKETAEIELNTETIPSGFYLFQVNGEDFQLSRKILK